MEKELILVKVSENHVATITLNRPQYLNTFTESMAEDLYNAMIALDNDPNVRVIIINGNGKAFCAGIDITKFNNMSALEYKDFGEKMERPLLAISEIKKPIIAQVHGVAAANGMGLVAAADLAIAADNCRMGLTAINVGLNCVGPVIPVSKSVGRKKSLELLLFGNLITAQEALELKLINKVTSEDALNEVTINWAEELAIKSPIAVQIAKRAFYSSEDMNYKNQFEYMNENFARLCTTADANEGITAFLEKRKPKWSLK